MKIAFVVSALFVGLLMSPVFFLRYHDYRDQQIIQQIEWNITTGGNGLYTSKDGKYQITVVHPYEVRLGSKADPDGYVDFYYMGGSNFIDTPYPETMEIFKKR